jgi:V8-like Glu-specific endopeptidase
MKSNHSFTHFFSAGNSWFPSFALHWQAFANFTSYSLTALSAIRLFTVIAILSAFPSQTFGVVMDPSTPDSAYRNRGIDALGFAGRPVYIKRFDPAARLGSLGSCSGALLNRHWAITAAHCVQPQLPGGTFMVGTGTNGTYDSGKLVRAKKAFVHPMWTGDIYFATVDIALLQLETPIDGFPDAILGTETPADSTIIVTAGFGRAGLAWSTLPGGLTGWLRGWHAPKSTVSGSWTPTTTFQTRYREGNYLHANGCPGDSGSPAYEWNSGLNQYTLVGITSASSTLNCSDGIGSTLFSDATKPHVRDWIAATIAANPPPVVPQPELTIGPTDVQIRLPNPLPANAAGPWLVSESTDLRNWSPGMAFLNGACIRPKGDRGFFRLLEDVPWVTATYDNLGETGSASLMRAYDLMPSVPGAISGGAENRGVRTLVERIGGTLETPFHADLNPPGPFSFEIWARPSQTAQRGVLGTSLAPDPVSGNLGGWLLVQGTDSPTSGNGFEFSIYTTETDSSRVIASYPSTLTAGAWYHVVGVFDGTSVILYVNGSLAASIPLPANTAFRANTWGPLVTCGRRGSWFLGDLDEPAFYSRALTNAEVQEHYQAGLNSSSNYRAVILSDQPKGYWPLTAPSP